MKIEKDEFISRMDILKKSVAESAMEAFIITTEENIYYLTGLTFKSLERLFILVVKADKTSFILPKMELAHLSHAINIDELLTYDEYPAKSGVQWADMLLNSLGNIREAGLELKSPFELAAVLSCTIKITPCDLLDRQRYTKSETEIELIRIASRFCDKAVHAINSKCYFGMTELEVLGIGKTIQKKIITETEFDYMSSSVLVAVWPGSISHQPHGIPVIGDRLKEGSHISLAFLRVNGYAAELERTFFTSKPGNREKELFRVMLDTRRQCYSVLKEGITGEEVDITAKEFLAKAGFAKNVMHRTGHGIGLGNHEGPFIAEGDKTILKENMIISIEPGIYMDGVGGFRHSDTVRITKSGYEILTHCPDNIDQLTFTGYQPVQRMKGIIARKMFGIK